MRKQRRSFTKEDDALIVHYMKNNEEIPKKAYAALKADHPSIQFNSKAMASRYNGHLKYPERSWTKDEDELLLRYISQCGKKYAYIAKLFYQRSRANVIDRHRILERRELRQNHSTTSALPIVPTTQGALAPADDQSTDYDFEEIFFDEFIP